MKHVWMLLGVVLLLGAAALGAPAPAAASEPAQIDDPVAYGEYLATVAGCIGCHTPFLPNSFDPDMSRAWQGGNPFDLGPLGVVFTKNLTSDEATGLGAWTDEEIKIAIRTGVSRDGLHLFPIMPYVYYNSMADADLDAIVAFLRTIPPANNPVPRVQILPPEALPQLPYQTGIVAPDPSDTAARGRYLMTSVIACSDCHTPVNPETGAPIFEQYLSGGQPFEGPWGIVYGGNITPDEETGIGTWSDEDIKRVLTQGVRPNGRVTLLMPWHETSHLTTEDLNAVVHYLRNDVPAVNRQVPVAALNEGFEVYVEIEEAGGTNNNLLWGVGLLALLVIAALGFYQSSKKKGATG